MSTRELIDKEIATLPENLQQKVYDFALSLKKIAGADSFNGAQLSESVRARDWNSVGKVRPAKLAEVLAKARSVFG